MLTQLMIICEMDIVGRVVQLLDGLIIVGCWQGIMHIDKWCEKIHFYLNCR
jgi:hypothetical protein